MKSLVISLTLFVLGFSGVHAQNDTVVCPENNFVSFFAASRGVASIPAFSIPNPAAGFAADLGIYKNLRFAPDFAVNLGDGGTGWYLDTWLRWVQPLDSLGRFTATVGFDWSLFMQPLENNGGVVSQSIRYPTYELAFGFTPNPNHSIGLSYWYTYAVERSYGTAGHYVSLSHNWTYSPKFTEDFSGILKTNPFWIDFSDGSRGLLIAETAQVLYNELDPLGLYIALMIMSPITVGTNARFTPTLSVGAVRKL